MRRMLVVCLVAALVAMVAARLPSGLHSIKHHIPSRTPLPMFGRGFSAYTNTTMAELQVVWERDQDIFIIDVREQDEFARTHIPGAYSYPLSTLETHWRQLPITGVSAIYVHCLGGVRSLKAINLLQTLGYTTAMVNVQDGFNGWKGPTAEGLYDNITAAQLLSIFTAKKQISIIDVRETNEFQEGHIPGAHNLPLSTLEKQHTILPVNYPTLYIHCLGGVRSIKAIETLLKLGYRARMINISDGFRAWTGPVEVGSNVSSASPVKKNERFNSWVEAIYAMGLAQRAEDKKMTFEDLIESIESGAPEQKPSFGQMVASLFESGLAQKPSFEKMVESIYEAGIAKKPFGDMVASLYESGVAKKPSFTKMVSSLYESGAAKKPFGDMIASLYESGVVKKPSFTKMVSSLYESGVAKKAKFEDMVESIYSSGLAQRPVAPCRRTMVTVDDLLKRMTSRSRHP